MAQILVTTFPARRCGVACVGSCHLLAGKPFANPPRRPALFDCLTPESASAAAYWTIDAPLAPLGD